MSAPASADCIYLAGAFPKKDPARSGGQWSPNDNAVSSTAGTLLPPNTIFVARCSPGQRVSAISNDAGTFSLSITELTD
jgi:hypothetical protein